MAVPVVVSAAEQVVVVSVVDLLAVDLPVVDLPVVDLLARDLLVMDPVAEDRSADFQKRLSALQCLTAKVADPEPWVAV